MVSFMFSLCVILLFILYSSMLRVPLYAHVFTFIPILVCFLLLPFSSPPSAYPLSPSSPFISFRLCTFPNFPLLPTLPLCPPPLCPLGHALLTRLCPPAVTCGPPPVFANARYTLLNGSTHWNGIAVYSCADGFRLHRGQWRCSLLSALVLGFSQGLVCHE